MRPTYLFSKPYLAFRTPTSTVDPGINYPKLNPQANLRLFCFPYAGGAARIFQTPQTVRSRLLSLSCDR
ncbi:MAG: hypothetical protein RIM23_19230 [Coleofasciculus sp. G3-WIS-01]|uniref:hypothetical protein n=1 Tax=Coleofasciculus sp. G3-WIS-01 TaxID=3069528 RepID=UPI0032F9BADB